VRILTVLDGEPWGARHIVGSLRELGHDVHSHVYGEAVGEFYGRARAQEREKKNERLVEVAKCLRRNGGLDLIFCYAYDDFLLPAAAADLAGIGAPFLNLNVDMAGQWYRQIQTAKHFTFVLCSQRAHMQSLAAYGARTLFFPMAGRTSDANTTDEVAPKAAITFLGSPTPYRQQVLSLLERAGLSIGVYGRHWLDGRTVQAEYNIEKTLSDLRNYAIPRLRHEGLGGITSALASRLRRRFAKDGSADSVSREAKCGTLEDSSMASLFRNSGINLGFTRMRGLESGRHGNNQVKLRDFEVPLAGGFYLVEEAPDHRELFDVGREIVTWQSIEELIDKSRYYLARENERRAIAAAGQRRALKDHTWAKRFNDLFRTLGIA
jgi:hypothetical protein